MGFIYKIECLANNKIYIGQTKRDFKNRINEHKYDLKHNRHPNKDIQNDFNTFGMNKFRFSVLKECNNNDLIDFETEYIDFYGGIDNNTVYNKCNKYRHNDDYRKNQSNAQIGVSYISDIGRKSISRAHKGKRLSKEHIQKIIDNAKDNPDYGMRGKKHSESSKIKMSNAKKGIYDGAKNPNYKYTPDFINQLRVEYDKCHNYREVARQFNMNSAVVSALIRFGKCI